MVEKLRRTDVGAWEPKSVVGKMVKSGEITTLEQIIEMGRPVIEPEIIDTLIPELDGETLRISTTQRVTDSGKRMKFRVVMVIGDRKGHVGVGVGKSEEIKPAMEYAVREAKKNMIAVSTGCGSWECRCSLKHSVRMKTVGKEGSTIIKLKPAPKGIGLAGNDVVKKVLGMAGVQDVWSSMSGGRNVYNMAMATIHALDKLNTMKPMPEGE